MVSPKIKRTSSNTLPQIHESPTQLTEVVLVDEEPIDEDKTQQIEEEIVEVSPEDIAKIYCNIYAENAQKTRKRTLTSYKHFQTQFEKWAVNNVKDFKTDANSFSASDIVKYLYYYSTTTNAKGKKCSISSFNVCVAALKNMYQSKKGKPLDRDDLDASAALKLLKSNHGKGFKLSSVYDINSKFLQIADIKAIIHYLSLSLSESIKSNDHRQMSRVLLIWLDSTLSYYTMLRSNSRVIIKLDHLQIQDINFIESRYAQKMKIIGIKKFEGKNIKDESVVPQLGRIIRSKDLLYCPVFTLSFYLFARFQDNIEGIFSPLDPDADQTIKDIMQLKWKNEELLSHCFFLDTSESDSSATKAKTKLTSNHLLDYTNILLKKVLPNRAFKVKTHLGRRSAASISSDLGISEPSIMIQGGWTSNVFRDTYNFGQNLEYLYKMHGHVYYVGNNVLDGSYNVGKIQLDRSVLNWNSFTFLRVAETIFPWLKSSNIFETDNAKEFYQFLEYIKCCLIDDIIEFCLCFDIEPSFIHPVFLEPDFRKLYEAVDGFKKHGISHLNDELMCLIDPAFFTNGEQVKNMPDNSQTGIADFSSLVVQQLQSIKQQSSSTIENKLADFSSKFVDTISSFREELARSIITLDSSFSGRIDGVKRSIMDLPQKMAVIEQVPATTRTVVKTCIDESIEKLSHRNFLEGVKHSERANKDRISFLESEMSLKIKKITSLEKDSLKVTSEITKYQDKIKKLTADLSAAKKEIMRERADVLKRDKKILNLNNSYTQLQALSNIKNISNSICSSGIHLYRMLPIVSLEKLIEEWETHIVPCISLNRNSTWVSLSKNCFLDFRAREEFVAHLKTMSVCSDDLHWIAGTIDQYLVLNEIKAKDFVNQRMFLSDISKYIDVFVRNIRQNDVYGP